LSIDGQWHMQWSNGGEHLDITAHGSMTFNDDLTDVQSMSPGAYLKIRNWSNLVPHTVEIRNEGGSLTHAYFVGGLSRPWDEEARRWLAQELPVLIRRSGLGAEQRTRQILGAKGVGGVLDEIDKLEGDYVRRIYFQELLKAAPFTPATITPVILKVRDVIRSDYDRRVVLTNIASRVQLEGASAEAYLAAVGSMRSDYDRRVTLTALLSKATVTPALSKAVLQSTSAFHSDYDRSEVLRQLVAEAEGARQAAGATSLDSAAVELAVGQMKSDYEKSRVLRDLVAKPNQSADVRRAILTVVAGMHSDYERGMVLKAFVAAHALDSSTTDAFFQSVSALKSDYERAEVLLSVVNQGVLAPSARNAFIGAAESIRSQFDQNRVLAALVRSERR
jgi:bla regulator protein blaR1